LDRLMFPREESQEVSSGDSILSSAIFCPFRTRDWRIWLPPHSCTQLLQSRLLMRMMFFSEPSLIYVDGEKRLS